MLKIISSIISLALIIVITLFAISNREVVEITMFPFAKLYTLPVYAVVLLSIFFGFLWGAFIMSWGLLKATFKNKALHNTIRKHIDY